MSSAWPAPKYAKSLEGRGSSVRGRVFAGTVAGEGGITVNELDDNRLPKSEVQSCVLCLDLAGAADELEAAIQSGWKLFLQWNSKGKNYAALSKLVFADEPDYGRSGVKTLAASISAST